jgi:hypothetical protein
MTDTIPQDYENLAALEHERWAGWCAHMLEQISQQIVERDTRIAFEGLGCVRRWRRQIALPYDQLTEDEKELDRSEVQARLEPYRTPNLARARRRTQSGVFDHDTIIPPPPAGVHVTSTPVYSAPMPEPEPVDLDIIVPPQPADKPTKYSTAPFKVPSFNEAADEAQDDQGLGCPLRATEGGSEGEGDDDRAGGDAVPVPGDEVRPGVQGEGGAEPSAGTEGGGDQVEA